MDKKAPFKIHDPYLPGYKFDGGPSGDDTCNRKFTKGDMAYINAIELEEYEAETPMTSYEKKALRKWVASGHSLREAPPSKYAFIRRRYPDPWFLDIYREDRRLDSATKGMSDDKKSAYLNDYIRYSDDHPDSQPCDPGDSHNDEYTGDIQNERLRKLGRQIFYMCMYLSREGLYDEACEFIEAHINDETPFESGWQEYLLKN